MFESSCDVDLEDAEFLYGVFGDEQENFDFDARLDSSIAKGLNTQQEKSHISSLPNQSIEKNGVPSRPRTASDSTLKISNSKLSALRSEDPNKSNFSPVVLNERENKRKIFELSSLPKRNKRERKFPGPAGLLPDLKSRGSTSLLENVLEDDELNSSTMEELCSQGRCSGSVLEDEPWQSLLADLGPCRNVLDVVNVASVKRKAAARCFVGAKLPFLAAVLHHLDVSSPDPCVILRDPTGEIHGTLHREVWEQFGGELIVGSVLVIRNAGLLSTGVSCRRHYLNITANNLVNIYSASPKNLQRTVLHGLTSEDLSQIVEQWKKLLPCPSPGMESPSSIASPSLFNSSLNSASITPRTTNVSGSKQPIADHRLASDRIWSLHGVRGTTNVSCTPELVRGAAPVRHPGRNLLRSFSPSFSPRPRCTNQSQGQYTPYDNSIPSTSSFPNSGTSNIRHGMISHSNSNNSVTKVNPIASNSFMFDPVLLKPKKFNSNVFPHSNSDREHRNEGDGSACSQSSIIVNNNNKLVLSQSTQLTSEEQSMVENVFDGIDADTLFDDAFD